MSATRVRMSATRALHELHESAKNLDFDNDKSENIFPHPYISYVKNEKLQEVEQP